MNETIIKHQFNVGDTVYIVKGKKIVKAEVEALLFTVFEKENYLQYYVRAEDNVQTLRDFLEVHATKKIASTHLNMDD